MGRIRDRGVDDAKGSATLEIVVLLPAVLLATFGLVQGALYYHARDVALAAATDGLTAARARTGSADDGRRAALTFLRRAGGDDVLPGSAVDSDRTATAATVIVTVTPSRSCRAFPAGRSRRPRAARWSGSHSRGSRDET